MVVGRGTGGTGRAKCRSKKIKVESYKRLETLNEGKGRRSL